MFKTYYGVTKYGWEFVSDVTNEEIKILIKLGVIKDEANKT